MRCYYFIILYYMSYNNYNYNDNLAVSDNDEYNHLNLLVNQHEQLHPKVVK